MILCALPIIILLGLAFAVAYGWTMLIWMTISDIRKSIEIYHNEQQFWRWMEEGKLD